MAGIHELETGERGGQAGFGASMSTWNGLSDDACLYELLQILFRGGGIQISYVHVVHITTYREPSRKVDDAPGCKQGFCWDDGLLSDFSLSSSFHIFIM